jgi:hypothetical protein
MKTLFYETTGVLLQSGSSTPASPGDQVRLYLDQEYNSLFPEFVVGIIQNPISTRCGIITYRISYDDSTLPEGIETLRTCDVLNVVVVSCCDSLNDRVTELESVTETLGAVTINGSALIDGNITITASGLGALLSSEASVSPVGSSIARRNTTGEADFRGLFLYSQNPGEQLQGSYVQSTGMIDSTPPTYYLDNTRNGSFYVLATASAANNAGAIAEGLTPGVDIYYDTTLKRPRLVQSP